MWGCWPKVGGVTPPPRGVDKSLVGAIGGELRVKSEQRAKPVFEQEEESGGWLPRKCLTIHACKRVI